MTEDSAIAAKLLMREVQEIRQQQIRIAEAARTQNELLEKRTEEIRALILKGEAETGDRITDFFIGAYGIIDDAERSKPLRDLEAQMAGKSGQFFIVVRREKEESGPIFRGGPHSIAPPFGSRFHIKSRYFLGILTDDKLLLDLKGKVFSLPTKEYVELMDSEAEKKPGPFRFVDGELLKFPSRPAALEEMLLTTYDSARALEVIVGSDVVLAYSPPELHAKSGTQRTDWVTSLNRAMRLLGRPYPEAPEEKDKWGELLYTP